MSVFQYQKLQESMEEIYADLEFLRNLIKDKHVLLDPEESKRFIQTYTNAGNFLCMKDVIEKMVDRFGEVTFK